MTDGPINDLDDELLDDLADVADSYPPGVLPGLHPAELVTATFTGFSSFQARAVLDNAELTRWLMSHWNEHPPRPIIERLAESPNASGRLHALLLQRFRELSDPAITEAETSQPDTHETGSAE